MHWPSKPSKSVTNLVGFGVFAPYSHWKIAKSWIQLKTVLKSTSTTHWTVLGSNEGKLRLRLDVDCATMDQDDVFASTPTLVTLRVLLFMTL